MDYVGILAGLVVGALAGAANGVVIARFKVPPFIATLAGLTVYRGLSLVVTNGLPIIKLEGSFRFIGSGMIWGVPVPVIIMIVLGSIPSLDFLHPYLFTSYLSGGLPTWLNFFQDPINDKVGDNF